MPVTLSGTRAVRAGFVVKRLHRETSLREQVQLAGLSREALLVAWAFPVCLKRREQIWLPWIAYSMTLAVLNSAKRSTLGNNNHTYTGFRGFPVPIAV
jgi:hypothetical protein